VSPLMLLHRLKKCGKTIEREAFAVVCVWMTILVQFVVGPVFVVEGDYKNLQGSYPKNIRWSMFLQGLSFWYKHISGEFNWRADVLSGRDFFCHHDTVPDLDVFDEEHQIASLEHIDSKQVSGTRKLVRALTRSGKRKIDNASQGSPNSDPVSVELSENDKLAFMKEAHNSIEGHHGINRTLKILHF
jgi:hypothetical protein